MMNDFPEMLDSRTIYESDWVALYADKVRMPSGTVIDIYHRLHYPHESVCVVIANEKDEVLLIQSKRYVTGRLEWEVPAGRIEAGELPEAAARRECMEETGCTLKDLTFLCKQNPANGMSDLTLHVYAARVDSEAACVDADEVSGKRWVPKEQVLELLRHNEMQCGVSMLALLYAIQFYLR